MSRSPEAEQAIREREAIVARWKEIGHDGPWSDKEGSVNWVKLRTAQLKRGA